MPRAAPSEIAAAKNQTLSCIRLVGNLPYSLLFKRLFSRLLQHAPARIAEAISAA